MFDVAPSELLVLGAVALMVIPPKDLPKAMRVAGYWVGRARSVARQFRSGFDDMLRDAELQEMQARWQAENERIMREHPMPTMLPLTDETQGGQTHADDAIDAPQLVAPPVMKDVVATVAAAPTPASQAAPEPAPATPAGDPHP